MPFEISIPRLGWSMEEGTFVRWLKNDGDVIQPGDAVFELEGEKAAQDIEAVDSGILRIPANAPQPGSIVAVGSVIGFLVAEGEATPQLPAVGIGRPESLPSSPTNSDKSQPIAGVKTDAPAASPSVRRMAREQKLKLNSISGSGPAGRILADDVRRPAETRSTPLITTSAAAASPRARRVANELGIDWRQLTGTGRDGRVRESDVRHAATASSSDTGLVEVPVSSRRRTIANRMKASRDQTAPVTLTTRIDATNLVSLRNQFKEAGTQTVIPSYSDIVLKLVAIALQSHPMLAVRDEGGRWMRPSSPEFLNLGLAVDTPDGLIVPVIRSVGSMGLFEIAGRTQVLIEKCRTGKLTSAEMQGGVFTITNLGAFGIDAFTPIINFPETAVLGLGRIRREPMVVDEQIVPRDQMALSLTFDHRIVDGAPAARFLQSVSQAIENPSAWLLRGEG